MMVILQKKFHRLAVEVIGFICMGLDTISGDNVTSGGDIYSFSLSLTAFLALLRLSSSKAA